MLQIKELVTIGVLLLFSVLHTNAEYFSATSEMHKAIEVGQKLATDLDSYLKLEQTRLERIRRVAQRLASNELAPKLVNAPEDFFGNPVNAYLTVRRLTFNWRRELLSLLDWAQESEYEEGQIEEEPTPLSEDKAHLAELRARVEESASLLPGDSDLSGAAEALLRLQNTYKLTAENMAKGELVNGLKCPILSAAQCMHLGQRAYEMGDFLRAEEWFLVAYNRRWEEEESAGDGTDQVDKNAGFDFTIPDEAQPTGSQILDFLAYALGRQGRYSEALNVTRILLESDPEHTRAKENEAFYLDRLNKGEGIVGQAPPPKELSSLEQETEQYQAMCRGESLYPPPPSDSVYCHYTVPHPYYKIGPVKEEVLYPDPRVVMWYDVMYPSEIAHIQALAAPRLRRATVKNPVTGKLEFAFYRTSKSAWLTYNTDEITDRMKKRIHALTGLNMNTAEELQVGNYGIGGYYAPHFDFGRKREKDAFEVENGNRIATIIFYMTELKAGGGTVFNRVGAKVDAVRGAAGFWYNLYPSGEGDLRTRHVACPVLYGSKWVMNVWFHERGQEFIRPCNLKPDPIEIDDGF